MEDAWEAGSVASQSVLSSPASREEWSKAADNDVAEDATNLARRPPAGPGRGDQQADMAGGCSSPDVGSFSSAGWSENLAPEAPPKRGDVLSWRDDVPNWQDDVLSWRNDMLNCFTQAENTTTMRQLSSKRGSCWNAAPLTTGKSQHGVSTPREQLSLHSYWNPLSSFFGDTPQGSGQREGSSARHTPKQAPFEDEGVESEVSVQEERMLDRLDSFDQGTDPPWPLRNLNLLTPPPRVRPAAHLRSQKSLALQRRVPSLNMEALMNSSSQEREASPVDEEPGSPPLTRTWNNEMGRQSDDNSTQNYDEHRQSHENGESGQRLEDKDEAPPMESRAPSERRPAASSATEADVSRSDGASERTLPSLDSPHPTSTPSCSVEILRHATTPLASEQEAAKKLVHALAVRNHAVQTEQLDRSLFLFRRTNAVRRLATDIVRWSLFKHAVSCAIIGSTVLLMSEEPLQGPRSPRNAAIYNVDVCLSAFFIAEFALKVVSMGFVLGREAYLRDPWNGVDFLCVVSSAMGLVPAYTGVSAIKVLRTFRVLRPLVAIKRFKKTRLLLDTLFSSMFRILDVMYILLAFVLFMGVVGVELFQGKLHARCYHLLPGGELPQNLTLEELSARVSSPMNMTLAGNGRVCNLHRDTSSGYHCQANISVCGWYPQNPTNGVTSFDNGLVASLAVFQTITLEGWSDIMYFLMDSTDEFSGVCYEMACVILGGLLLMNLALAVVYESYMGQKAELEALEHKRKAAKQQTEEEMCVEEADLAERDAVLDVELDVYSGSQPGAEVGVEMAEAAPRAGRSRQLQALVSASKGAARRLRTAGRRLRPLLSRKAPGQLGVAEVVESAWFDRAIIALIILNVFFMCLYSYNAPPDLKTAIEMVNHVCAAAFGAELALKLAAWGPRAYFAVAFNCFDCLLVVFSVLVYILENITSSGVQLQHLTALRALRVVRIFKIARKWRELRRFVASMTRAAESVGPFCMVFFVVMMNAALIGMNFFAGKFSADYTWHYDTPFWAMATTFQVATGENWNDTMVRAVSATGWVAAVYFVVVFIILNTLMLNIVVSIIIDSCSKVELEAVDDEDQDSAPSATSLLEPNETVCDRLGDKERDKEEQLPAWGVDVDDAQLRLLEDPEWMEGMCEGSNMTRKKVLHLLTREKQMLLGNKPERFQVHGNSFGVLSPTNAYRLWALQVVSHKWFEPLIAVLIVWSSLMLALRNPNQPTQNMEFRTFEEVSDGLFIAAFTLEMILKMTVMGVVWGPGAYLRAPFNVLDLVIVVASWLALGLPELAVLRVVRAARPVRLFSRQRHLKLVVSALAQAVTKSGNVVAVGVFLFIIFAVSGVQMFSGTFYHCTNPAVETRASCLGTFFDPDTGLEAEAVWQHLIGSHFDTVPDAIVTLFEISTMEMWPDIVAVAMNSQGVDLGPKKDARVWVLAYFLMVIVLTSFFYLNLFVGIVVDSYTSICSAGDSEGLPDTLRSWHYILQMVQSAKPDQTPPPRKKRVEVVVQRAVMSDAFEFLVLGVVLLNVLVMGIQYFNAPANYLRALTTVMDACTYFYVAEALFKMFGLGLDSYFYSTWNCFDFFLVVVTTVVPYVAFALGAANIAMLGWVRILRVLRAVRLLRTMPGVGVLIEAMLASLVQGCSVLVVIGIWTFVYAVVGMSLYGAQDYQHAQGLLATHANFANFDSAMLLLVRCATGEAWSGIMHEVRQCRAGEGCAHRRSAVPFFVSYIFVVQLLLLNLLIAVVLNKYTICTSKRQLLIHRVHLLQFNELWKVHDPHASQFLPLNHFLRILTETDMPLGFKGGWCPQRLLQVIPHLEALRIRVYRSRPDLVFSNYNSRHSVNYHDILLALAARAFLKHTHIKALSAEYASMVKLSLRLIQSRREAEIARARRRAQEHAQQPRRMQDLAMRVLSRFPFKSRLCSQAAHLVDSYYIQDWIAVAAIERVWWERLEAKRLKTRRSIVHAIDTSRASIIFKIFRLPSALNLSAKPARPSGSGTSVLSVSGNTVDRDHVAVHDTVLDELEVHIRDEKTAS